jgi:hypothetical protein
MRPPLSGGRRWAVVVTATLAVSGVGVSTAPMVLAAPVQDPAVVGSWTAPFEEGGAGTPRCEVVNEPADAADQSAERLECKPTAVTAAVLPDGRVLYGNGLEGEENAEEGVVLSLAPENRTDRTRVLDLRSGRPAFTVPENERSDGDNPTIAEGRTSQDCVLTPGFSGVPGRPGDGLVGSLAGQTGTVPEQEPSCAPDDVGNNDGNMFCGDVAQLADGRQILIGGTDFYNEPSILEQAEGDPVNAGIVELEGLRSAQIFDPTAGEDGLGRWDATDPMQFGRWYPAATTLPDGDIAAVSGTVKLIKSTQLSQVRRTEVFDARTETWQERHTGPASEKTLPQNPRMYLTPNGKLFYSGDGQMWGPFGQAADEILFAQQGFFNFETDEWENTGVTLPRSSPVSVALPMQPPYDEMTILRAGGTLGPPPGSHVAVSTTTLTTVDSEGNVTEEAGPDLNHARWFSQPTPLPTGEVLITSGARNDEVVAPGLELPVTTPEIYNPETGEFTELALPERARTYHNNALLLPNGQVLVGGNSPFALGYGVQRDAVPGITGNNDKDPSFELFNPPYLHKGDRPHIDRVRSGLVWGRAFEIVTEDAASVTKVTLMRMPSPQHVMDNDTRTLELPFTDNGDGTITASTPPDGVAAPPGYYYLFVNRTGEDGSYVPSVARIVQVGETANYDEAIEPMSEDSVFDFTGNGATPTEVNTLLNNPPNPLDSPTVPGGTDPLAPPLPDGIPGLTSPVPDATGSGTGQNDPNDNGADERPEVPTDQNPAEGIVPGGGVGGSEGRHHRAQRQRSTRTPVGTT